MLAAAGAYRRRGVQHDAAGGAALEQLHHVAFNVQRHEHVDELFALVRSLGAEFSTGRASFRSGRAATTPFTFWDPIA